MINKYSINAISNAMRVIKMHNVALSVNDDSPIGLLNRSVDPQAIYDHAITDEDYFGRLENITARRQPEKGTGEPTVYVDSELAPVALCVDDHEVTLHDLKTMAINRCDAILDFSRNVLQPFVQDVMKNMVIVDHKGVSEDWTLIPVALDCYLKEPIVDAVLSAVSNPTGNGFVHDPFPICVPDTLAIPETGSRAYDTVVRKLVEESGMSIVAIAKEMLQASIDSPGAGDAHKNVKRKVLYMLLAAHFKDHPWEDSGVTAQKWESMMLKLFYTMVGWVYLYMQNYVQRIDSGFIIINSSEKDKTVTVCQEAFDKFASSGGCAECLFGAIYESESGSGVSLLAENLLKEQDRYVNAWKRRSEVTSVTETTNWLSKNRDAMKKAFSIAIDNLEPGYYVEADDNVSPEVKAKKVKEAAYCYIDGYLESDTVDLTVTAIQCAAGAVFREFECGDLTKTVHKEMIENRDPGAAAREWIIEYVLNWILAGFYISSKRS